MKLPISDPSQTWLYLDVFLTLGQDDTGQIMACLHSVYFLCAVRCWALLCLLVFQAAFVWVGVIHTASEQKLNLTLLILELAVTKADELHTEIVFVLMGSSILAFCNFLFFIFEYHHIDEMDLFQSKQEIILIE